MKAPGKSRTGSLGSEVIEELTGRNKECRIAVYKNTAKNRWSYPCCSPCQIRTACQRNIQSVRLPSRLIERLNETDSSCRCKPASRGVTLFAYDEGGHLFNTDATLELSQTRSVASCSVFPDNEIFASIDGKIGRARLRSGLGSWDQFLFSASIPAFYVRNNFCWLSQLPSRDLSACSVETRLTFANSDYRIRSMMPPK